MPKHVLKATTVRVIGTTGANKQPASGNVKFSDDKHFGFGLNHASGRYEFTTYAGIPKRGGLVLPKREAALLAALESGEGVDSSPLKINLN